MQEKKEERLFNNSTKRNGIVNNDNSKAGGGASHLGARQHNTRNLPSISLPKGGGAITGIGEKFASNPVTGTASFSVPIYTSPGRSGFGPQLSLSHDSGTGNGIFGFGWSISTPSITRKTDKAIPTYHGAIPKYQDTNESRVFILSGVEDLVPVLVQDSITGEWNPPDIPPRTMGEIKYNIKHYRPRIEGLFARIEQWTNTQTDEIHWRSISKDNVITLYGKTEESRIADPQDPKRIFSWLICETYDDKGNAILYQYKRENSHRVDLSLANERNRTDETRSANCYLKRIKYGNKNPYQIRENLLDRTDWMFEVVFDYGEHYSEDEHHQPLNVLFNVNDDDIGHQWDIRQDPFSSYRSGFEIRTYRLCQRVLMFHHFPDELGITDYLVKCTEFTYAEDPVASFITSITQSGFVLNSDGKYQKKSLPPLEFEYSQATIQDDIKEIDQDSLENLPAGVDGMQYQWVDLDGEGLAGILTEQAGAWFYKHNLSSLPILKEVSSVDHGSEITRTSSKSTVVARFAPLQREESIPSFSDLGKGRQQLMDLQGDGKIDLVRFNSFISGYFKRSRDAEDWETFIPFSSLPNVEWQDPNLRFVDLTGDGHADILITEERAFSWYQSLAEKGFNKNIEKVNQSIDEEKGPRLIFDDGTQSTYLADMSGDGLTDLVHIGNGEVWYKPNLGYGHFGSKVTMDHSPWFGMPDQFDQKRIRLADIDGSGTTDIIYLGQDGIHIYKNLSGNSLSGDQRLSTQFPHMDSLSSSMMVADLLGNGTACLVWSSSLPSDGSRTMYYIDLMGGQKPHLLISIKNNMGAETRLQYAPSTKFYLADKYAGKPWITRLPFPVHVVERVETYDMISRTRLISRYAYHHGYFDGVEREFRGFGFVEQWDTESFDLFNELGLFSMEGAGTTSISPLPKEEDESFHVPPIHIKTWFHTGAYIDAKYISRHFADKEYFKENDDDPAAANILPDSLLPDGLLFNEKTEAYRALKGLILRQEIYSEDNSEESAYPYSVVDHNYLIKLIQPMKEDVLHAVFYPHERENITFYYERNPDDPRVQHQFVLDVDMYGNVTKQAVVYYPRRSKTIAEGKVYPEQLHFRGVVNLTDYAEKISSAKIADERDIWITGQLYQSKSLEINGLEVLKDELPKDRKYFQFSEIYGAMTKILEKKSLDYGENFDSGGAGTTTLQARIFHWEKNYYWNDSQDDVLNLGSIGCPVLLNHNETAMFPVSYFDGPDPVYDKTVLTDKIIQDEGGYRKDVGYWWDKGVRQYYFSKAGFYLPHISVDQFGSFDPVSMKGSYSQVEYDGKYHLAPVKFIDPLKNHIQADINYRVLKPKQIVDINDNTSQAYYDELGIVIASSIFGHEEEVLKGDGNLYALSSSRFKIISDATLKDVIANPQKYIQNATSFFFYDYISWKNAGIPLHVVSIQREVHVSDQKPSEKPLFQITLLYSDGLGRELQKKLNVEEGLAWVRQGDGSYKEQDSLERWLTSGGAVYNNKGKPIKQYEPFYSASSEYESEKSLTEFGVTPIIHYDPLERVIRTDTPKGFFSNVVFDPWKEEHRDENDNVKESRFYDEMLNHDKHPPSWTSERIDAEKEILRGTESHANTPKVVHMNNMAQLFLEEDLVDGENLYTYHELDINGNKLSITDPRQHEKNKSRSTEKRVKNFRFSYDMLNRQLQSISTDAGITKGFQNSLNNPIYSWTARNFVIHTEYDPLQRPILVNVKGGDGDDTLNNIVEKIQYGESNADRKKKNQCGKPVKLHDQAGIKEFLLYDIKGHNIKLSVRLRDEYRKEVNWTVEPEPSFPGFYSEVSFDALGRMLRRKQSDQSVHERKYHRSGLLKSVAVELVPGSGFKNHINDIQYNAKGQRLYIQYGNRTTTRYEYDPKTFRLESLKTHRSSEPSKRLIQDISYVYDPVGNITYIKDSSHRTAFHSQTMVEPVSTFRYDSVYRLKAANGRQHPAVSQDDYKYPGAFKQSRYISFESVSINDSTALENYSQTYGYDYAGNLENIIHFVPTDSSRGWTRKNTFEDDSNRIKSSVINSNIETYTYDATGNMNKLEHLRQLNWNYRDNLSSAVLINRDEDSMAKSDVEYYVYNSDGMRVRKVMERYIKIADTFRFLEIEEKIYLDGYEIKQIKRINLETKESTVSLKRSSCHVMGDKNRISIIHRWDLDTKNLETDDTTKIKIHYQLGNHLGSCSFEINGEERIITYEEYYPYGGTSFIAGISLRSSARREVSIKEYRYIGKERDDSTGLYYYRARYYVSWLGRWISADPAMISGGENLYGYANNNPIVLIDSNGLAPQKLSDQYVELDAEKLRINSQITELQASRMRAQNTLGNLISARNADARSWWSKLWSKESGDLNKAIKEAEQRIDAQTKQIRDLSTKLQSVDKSMEGLINKMELEEYIISLERTGQKEAADKIRYENMTTDQKFEAKGITKEKFGEHLYEAKDGPKGNKGGGGTSPPPEAGSGGSPVEGSKGPSGTRNMASETDSKVGIGSGVEKGIGVIGIGLFVYDLAKAKDSNERLHMVSNFVQGTIILNAAGAPGRVIGAGFVGYGFGTFLAKEVIPDPVNIKVGQKLVEQVRKSPENSFIDPLVMPIGKFIVEDVIGAKPEEFY